MSKGDRPEPRSNPSNDLLVWESGGAGKIKIESPPIYCPKCGLEVLHTKLACENCYTEMPKPRARATKVAPDTGGLFDEAPGVNFASRALMCSKCGRLVTGLACEACGGKGE